MIFHFSRNALNFGAGTETVPPTFELQRLNVQDWKRLFDRKSTELIGPAIENTFDMETLKF